jgi:FtsZ-interacting cell division protein ZipA
MSTGGWIAIIVAIVVVAVLVIAWLVSQQQRSKRLRSKFGPEYDHALDRTGDRRRAEEMLEKRQERVERLHIRDLAPEDQRRFSDAWRSTQAKFVDSPREAIADAERLVQEVMKARGYPIENFDQRAADISVDHPNVVSNYRSARDLAVKSDRGQASTEDLRQAMIHYRALFEDLLGRQGTSRPETAHTEARR